MLQDFFEELVIRILLDWIEVADIVCLDTACATQEWRAWFFNIVSSRQFVAKQNFLYSSLSPACLQWYIKRRIKPSHLSFGSEIDILATVEFFAKVVGSHTTDVELLNCADCQILLALTANNCQQLARLMIKNCSEIAGVDVVLRFSQNTLCSISISGPNNSMPQVENMQCHFPNLKVLLLHDAIDINLLYALLEGSSNLEDLDLACNDVDDDCLQVFSKQAEHLIRFSRALCDGVSDEAMRRLAQAFTRLQQLDIGHCQQLSVNAALSFFHSCSQLESLALRGRQARTLSDVARHCGSRLQALTLENASYTSQGLIPHSWRLLAELCRNLKHLALIKIFR